MVTLKSIGVRHRSRKTQTKHSLDKRFSTWVWIVRRTGEQCALRLAPVIDIMIPKLYPPYAHYVRRTSRSQIPRIEHYLCSVLSIIIFPLLTMISHSDRSFDKLAHYRAWTKGWSIVPPSKLPAEECLDFIIKQGPQWLHGTESGGLALSDHMHQVIACFKTAANAHLILLGGKVPPTYSGCDVMSEDYDARIECNCSGFDPISNDLEAAALKSCTCEAIRRMMTEGEIVNNKEPEWNTSVLFTSKDLSSAMIELSLSNADVQPSPSSCRSENKHGKANWPEVRAPDRKPDPSIDLDDNLFNSLYPTSERIRLSADAKYFHAFASGASLVDPGILLALADSGNDILIADYCEAASAASLLALQQTGAAAFAFLKLCVYSGMLGEAQFNDQVAQTVQFRVIGYYRDHALPRRPRGVYGSRMTGVGVQRYVDLGTAVSVTSAALATGATITARDYHDLVDTTALINDLVDFRGDTWRNQRENVVLRGVRGCLCMYLDGMMTDCVGGAAVLVRRGKAFALNIMCFCNWMLLSTGHKVYELLRDIRAVDTDPPCRYQSEESGLYEDLLGALEAYGTLGEGGPKLAMKRKDLQLLYAVYRRSPETHIKWLADAVRLVLHPRTLRRLVDVVHYQWTGEIGDAGYCA